VNAPVFSGVSSVTPNNDGSFSISWSAATGTAQNPLRYRIYIALGVVSSGTLFSSSNYFVSESGALSARLYTLADGSLLIGENEYTIGVRAESASGIIETNSVVISDTAISNLYSIVSTYLDVAVSSRLPTASYVAPDNTGITNIYADTQDLITSVNNLPTLADIEASTVLALEATSQDIKNKEDTIIALVSATL
jgi:hypothetical protein